jgi:hypothetical protein
MVGNGKSAMPVGLRSCGADHTTEQSESGPHRRVMIGSCPSWRPVTEERLGTCGAGARQAHFPFFLALVRAICASMLLTAEHGHIQAKLTTDLRLTV